MPLPEPRCVCAARAYALPRARAGGNCVYVSAALSDALRAGEVSARPLGVQLVPWVPGASLLAGARVCWADVASPEMEDSVALAPGAYAVFLPSAALAAQLGAGDEDAQVAVAPVQPVPLSAVYMAVAQARFAHVAHRQEALQRALHGLVLGQGGEYELDLDGDLSVRVVMSEPVAQGVVDCGTTQVFVLGDARAPEAEPAPAEPAPAAIDARFLEQGVLPAEPCAFAAEPLSDPEPVRAAIAHWQARDAEVHPGVEHAARYVDEESAVLLSDAGLARLAAFHGDWALAEVYGEERPRLVRVFGAPSGAPDAARVPPVLLQNLFRAEHFDPARSVQLSLRALPTGAQEAARGGAHAPDAARPPLVPVAETLRVARVAAPVSTDRAYEALCLDALRAHFEQRPRVWCRGDVFAVRVAAGRARFAQVDLERQGAPTEPDSELVAAARFPGAPGPAFLEAPVFFAVADVEPPLVDPGTVRDAIPEEAAALRDWYHTLAAAGGLDAFGCWVDARETRMVQAGVERRRVADVRGWLRLAVDTPECPAGDSALTRPGSVYARYVDLVHAALSPRAAQLGARMSVLLEGAAGTGKRTVCRWVAQRTGVHLVELDGYELVSDTDARTEGVLRARLERARACAPCLLVVRNVDALARKGANDAPSPAVRMLQRSIEEMEADGDEDGGRAARCRR